MKSELTIRTKDLRRLSAAVDPAHLGAPGDGLPTSVLAAVRDLVPCDSVSFLAIDPARGAFLIEHNLEPDPPFPESDPVRVEEFFWRTYRSSRSCSYQYWTGDHSTVTRATDFYASLRTYFSSDVGELMRMIGGRFSVLVPLPPDNAVQHQMVLFRDSGSDFSERDQILLGLLRPHLAALHVETRRRQDYRGLTPRQAQLVALVAEGLTNRQIATRLELSEGTVRTHMEHIFERLAVSSRAAAVACMNGIEGLS